MDTSDIPLTTDRSFHASIRQWGSRIVIAGAAALLLKLAMLVPLLILGLGDVSAEAAAQSLDKRSIGSIIFWSLIIAPLVETLLMGWFILATLHLGLPRYAVILASGVLWGAVHQLNSPIGWAAGFGFLVLSYVFIERNRTSGDGYSVATMAHFFANVLALVAVISTR